MTYFGFLARFLMVPIGIMIFLLWRDRQQARPVAQPFRTWPAWTVVVGLIGLAMVYTTPWDNYLVATSVWWYDEALVTGLTLGYVPIEEYTFFVLQTWLTGMWMIWLMQRPALTKSLRPFRSNGVARWGITAVIALIWLVSTWGLFFAGDQYNYLTLILSWALVPILIQTIFGGDILWHYGRLLLLGIVPSTAYLATADALAILSGTWTISDGQTVGILLAGVLPLEEFLFFLITNVLVVFGMVLFLAQASHERAGPYLPERMRVDNADQFEKLAHF